MKNAAQKKAFSLIELLVTLAIVAILATIAIPAYSSHLIKAKRRHAETALMHLAIRLEQFHSLEGTYQHANGKTLQIAELEDSDYVLSIQTQTEHDFLITATPLSQTARKDTQCGTLSLNAAGHRMISGTGSVKTCWQ